MNRHITSLSLYTTVHFASLLLLNIYIFKPLAPGVQSCSVLVLKAAGLSKYYIKYHLHAQLRLILKSLFLFMTFK